MTPWTEITEGGVRMRASASLLGASTVAALAVVSVPASIAMAGSSQ